MFKRMILLTEASVALSGPALAIGPASGTVPGTSTSAPTTASQCDGCNSSDGSDTTAQTDQTNTGQGVTGPVTDPSTPRPAHTDTPSHVSQPPSGPGNGGTPKESA
jgi:hypothetical protein